MAETTAPDAPSAAGPATAPSHVLLVVIASDPASMDDLLTALLDIGITGATLIDSKGMATVLREEMPIFSGLAALLPGTTGSRMLFSVTTSETASQVLDYVTNQMRADAKPIAAVVPVTAVAGLKR
ncbi:MAG: hypothetical protein D6693_11310 [Planctomycetota bacterium]|nr:MAG: hypothetical protein D6693_11310 [Planctomycetota bacterium]